MDFSTGLFHKSETLDIKLLESKMKHKILFKVHL